MTRWAKHSIMTRSPARAIRTGLTFSAGVLRVRACLVIISSRWAQMLHTVLRLTRTPMPWGTQIGLVSYSLLQAIVARRTCLATDRTCSTRKIVVCSSRTWDKSRSWRAVSSRWTKILDRGRLCCWKRAVKPGFALGAKPLTTSAPKSHRTGPWETVSVRTFMAWWTLAAVAT